MLLTLHHDLFTVPPAGAFISAKYSVGSSVATGEKEGSNPKSKALLPLSPHAPNSQSVNRLSRTRKSNNLVPLVDGTEVCACLPKKEVDSILSRHPEDAGLVLLYFTVKTSMLFWSKIVLPKL
jgi:hypothetical protein